MIPRKGAIVAGISEKMLTDVLQVRMTLEKMAYSCAFDNFTDYNQRELSSAEAEFENAVESGDIIRIAESDERFHYIIYQATNNDKLKGILNNLKENMYRYRLEYIKNVEARAQLIEEHRAICDSFSERDMDKGLNTVEVHIRNQEIAILDKLRQEELDKQGES